MQIKRFKNKKGLTLIEMLLYMGILSILLITFTEIFVSILETKLGNESFSSISQESKFIEAKISKDLRKNEQILTPNTGTTENEMEITINGINYRYYLNGQTLFLEDSSGNHALHGELLNIDTFSVSNDGKIIQVTLDLESEINKVGEDDSISILIKHKIR